MKVTAELPDRDVLRDKRILFVEDRPDTMEYFVEELIEFMGEEVKIDWALSLGEAVDKISIQDPPFDLVVIDLLIPGPIPESLNPFQYRVAPVLNQGQVLGLWLHAKDEPIPYIYFSAVPDAYKPVDGDVPEEDAPMNKFLEPLVDFPGHLAQVFRKAGATDSL